MLNVKDLRRAREMLNVNTMAPYKYDKYIHQVYVSIAFSVSIHMQLVFIRRNHNIVIENDSELMTCYTVHYNI